MAGQMRRRLLPEHALPARPQAMEIEIARRAISSSSERLAAFRNRSCWPHRTTPLLTPSDP